MADIRSDALFILLVEKDAAFMRLAEDRFYNTYPCIILTAKGQPDVATRCRPRLHARPHDIVPNMRSALRSLLRGLSAGLAVGASPITGCSDREPVFACACSVVSGARVKPSARLDSRWLRQTQLMDIERCRKIQQSMRVRRLFLKRLRDVLRIPVLALVDADPYGLKILSVYMKGACLLTRYHACVLFRNVYMQGTHALHIVLGSCVPSSTFCSAGSQQGDFTPCASGPWSCSPAAQLGGAVGLTLSQRLAARVDRQQPGPPARAQAA